MASYRRKGSNYEFRVCIHGVKRSKSFASIKEGKIWAKHEEVNLLQQNKAPRSQYPTIRELSQLYSQHILPTLKGAAQERSRLHLLHNESFIDTPCHLITASDIRHYIERLRSIGNSSSTIRLKLCLISSLYRLARQELNMEIQSPTSAIKMPASNPGRLRRLSPNEESSLLRSASLCKNPNILPVITFALETGLRRNELLTLDWSAYQSDRGLIEIKNTKNGYPRWIPLTQLAKDILEGQLRYKYSRPFPVNATTLENAWEHILDRAGIENLRFHDLRHEALSRWAHKLKGDVFKLSMISGHRTLQMAQRYVHPVMSEMLHNAIATDC